MATTEATVLEIPYLAQTGRPFHKLSDAQRRWYTQGKLTQAEESELLMHCGMIEERVKHYQALRQDLKKKGTDELKFREDTPLEERERRLKVVEGYKKEYKQAYDNIVKLKTSVFNIEPGNMMLEPAI